MALSMNVDTEELRDMVRLSTTQLDDELETLLGAFLMDIAMAGVQTIPDDVSHVKACLRLYLRWHMNYGGEGGKYQEMYARMKEAMSLAEEYREKTDDNG